MDAYCTKYSITIFFISAAVATNATNGTLPCISVGIVQAGKIYSLKALAVSLKPTTTTRHFLIIGLDTTEYREGRVGNRKPAEVL